MATDNFTRANETPLASPWASDSVLGGMNLVSNTARGNSSADLSYYPTSVGAYSEITLASGSNGNGGPVICGDGAGSGYTCTGSFFGVLSSIVRLDSGGDTFIGATGSAYTAGDVIRLRRSGNDIILSVNGVDTLTQTDTTYMTGYNGMFVFDTAMWAGSWTDGAGGGGSPTITDVNTTEVVLDGATGMAVTGTGMGTTNADRAFTLRQTGATSVTQTETGTGTATAATLTISISTTIKFGATTLRCTLTSGGATGDIAITVNPPSGQLYIDIGTPAASGSDRITSTPDLASGDQVQARGVGGGAVPAGLTLYTDGTFGFTPGNPPTAFDVRVYDNAFTWGAWATQSIAGLVSKRKLLLLGIGR